MSRELIEAALGWRYTPPDGCADRVRPGGRERFDPTLCDQSDRYGGWRLTTHCGHRATNMASGKQRVGELPDIGLPASIATEGQARTPAEGPA